MGRIFVISFLAIFADVTLSSPRDSQTASYPFSVDLNKKLSLSWRLSYPLSTIYFRVRGQLSPFTWFGVGFSNYGEMSHADFVVCWTGVDGVHHFQDSHTDDGGRLWPDRKQNYYLQSARMDDRQMTLQFYRKFDTCDDDDYLIDNGTTHVIFFTSDDPHSSLLHVNISRLTTGLQRVQLLKPEVNPPPLPDDTWVFEITSPNVEVPATETTYWWYTTRLPAMSAKHHIVKYEGIIDGGSESLVHHMEVFHCEVPASERVRYYNGPGQSEGMPTKLEYCRKVIGAWAMGAKPHYMPAEAGIPVGGSDFSRYVLLEVHYNNPQLRAGIRDSSGIRFYVTSQVRQYDAGIMELGLEYTNKMAIPPEYEKFPLTGYCINQCTQVGLPAEGIRVYASQLHTHLTGRRVYTKHVRNGTELPELNRDNHYSPHFQEIRQLPVPVHVLPGDDLITTCEDRTVGRPNVTLGGFAISDEMCVNYIHYYPRVDLEVCKSSVSTRALGDFFKFLNKWDGAVTSPGQGDRANYNSVRWTPLTGFLLKTFYHTSPIDMQCNKSDGARFPGDWRDMRTSNIVTKLPLPERTCDSHYDVKRKR